MIGCLMLVALAAAPEPTIQLASPGFNAANVREDLARFFSDDFAQQLTLSGLKVVTASEMGALLGLERQRALLGCAEQATSCMAELANALGVDGMVTGSIGHFAQGYRVNIKILSATSGEPLALASFQARDDQAVLDELQRSAERMAAEVAQKLGRPLPKVAHAPAPRPEPQASSGGMRSLAWLPAAIGVAVAASGGVLLARAAGDYAHLRDDTFASPADAQKVHDSGVLQQGLGTAGVAVGAAGLLAGGAMLLFGGESTHASVAVGPGGASVVVAGVFP